MERPLLAVCKARSVSDELAMDAPPGTVAWLQAWFASNCDGDWEHQEGIEIGTLDNPGWRVRINLTGTALEGCVFDWRKRERSEHNWIQWRSDGSNFDAACGCLNLEEALHQFRLFVEQRL